MAKLLEFNNKLKVPNIGLGTWLSKPGEVKKAVIHAIKLGYRHIDCAWIYQNENEIGEALSEVFKSGIVKREDLFITSKLWNSSHRPEIAPNALEETLTNLQIDYLDLYLIHWPVSYKPGTIFPTQDEIEEKIDEVDLLETWKAMESFVDAGKVKSIGLSNFNISQIQNILNNSRIKPSMVQVEISLYWPNTDLVNFCHANGIQVTAYSPLGAPGRPGAPEDDKVPLDDPLVKQLLSKYQCTPAQLLISYVLHRDLVCIPKSVNPIRIDENYQSLKVILSDEDMKKLNNVKIRKQAVYPTIMKIHKEFPF